MNAKTRLNFVFFLLITAMTPSLAFDLQGHRGARGLLPENTLPAFERAIAIGVTTLELDIGVTADGVVVVAHDQFLNPSFTRDAQGNWLEGARGPLIRSLTLAQLQTYDVGRLKPGTPYAQTFNQQEPRDGTRIPTLASLFERVKALGATQVRFNIETKINPSQPDDTVSPEVMTRALLAVVAQAGMNQRVTIQSFDWRTLKLVQQLAPGIPTAFLTVQGANSNNVRNTSWTAGLKPADYASTPLLVRAAGASIWSPNAGALTEPLLREAQALGLQVIPWTVNVAADMQRLIAWRVDGIITDYPDVLKGLLTK